MKEILWTGWSVLLGLTFVFIAALAVAVLKRGGKRGKFVKARPMTDREQAMFWRLSAAFPPPQFVVLAQVSFSALLRAKEGASRFSFSQKRADFVLYNRGFTVIAVIELDDSSHRGREERDRQRDAMLAGAGYRVLRYPAIPEIEKLREDMAAGGE